MFGERGVVWQLIKFGDDSVVGLSAAEIIFVAQFSKWNAVNVLYPEQGRGRSVVNREGLFAGLAAVTVSLASFSKFNCFDAVAVGTVAMVFFLALSLESFRYIANFNGFYGLSLMERLNSNNQKLNGIHIVRFGPLAESEEPAGCTAQNPVTVVPNGKSRMISIRISDDDYREIKSRCGERGPAIVSEFVRAAAMHALSLPEMFSFPAFLSLQVSALERRLDRLDEQVSTLADRMSIASQQQG